MSSPSCLILGASGFVGGELLRLLAGHPSLRVRHATGASEAGRRIGEVHPHLALAYPDHMLETFDAAMLDEVDLVLSCLPHGETQKLADTILQSAARWVDLGADFRLQEPAGYEQWYGAPHLAPELIEHFATGIPEWHREEIAGAKAVAAAGCYATAAILTLKPLARAGLLAPSAIAVTGLSGVSGAGKTPSPATHFDSVSGAAKAYGLLSHRHTGEMEQALGGHPVLFTPHLVAMDRGILVTCVAEAAGEDDPLEVLRDAYAGEPFVRVTDEPPATKATLGSNAAHLTARYDPRTGSILAIGAIDNLGKGAAGQMIQCANIMLGLPETDGLATTGVWP